MENSENGVIDRGKDSVWEWSALSLGLIGFLWRYLVPEPLGVWIGLPLVGIGAIIALVYLGKIIIRYRETKSPEPK